MQASMRRSQVLLRLPVDNVEVTLILHDGERGDAVLFMPPTDSIAMLLAPGAPRFLPMIRGGKVTLVARDAIAALGEQAIVALPQDGDLPVEVQAAVVQLRSGTQLAGELRWSAPAGQARTADHLNGADDTFELFSGGLRFHVVKAHVALVEER
jgi:hypothetical protein